MFVSKNDPGKRSNFQNNYLLKIKDSKRYWNKKDINNQLTSELNNNVEQRDQLIKQRNQLYDQYRNEKERVDQESELREELELKNKSLASKIQQLHATLQDRDEGKEIKLKIIENERDEIFKEV